MIAKATATLTWNPPAAIVHGTPLSATQLNASASVPGTFTYTPAAGVVLGAGPAQALSASFAPADPQNYDGGTVSTTITVDRDTPTLDVAGGTFTYDGQPHAATVSATGAGGAALTPVVVTYNGSAAAPVAAGSYTVEATYAGDANHAPASATSTITISKAAAVLSWAAPAPVSYGTALSAAQLNATSNVPGTFVYAPAAGTILPVGPGQPLTATFTPSDAQNYDGGTVSTTIAVERAAATVIVTGGTFTYDGQPHAASASATGVGGTALTPVAVTYNGSSATPVAAGSYAVEATFAGDATHAPASATATITIGKAAVSLTWGPPAPITYGTALGAAQLAATASVPGTFIYTPAAGTVLAAGVARPLSATFTPADAENYASGSVTSAITVVPAPLVVRTIDAVKAYGAPLPAFTASFTGLVAGDTPASLTGALAFATTATASSPIGTYTVTPGGLSSPNYAIGFVNGTLGIDKAPVTVTISASPEPSGIDMPITLTATVVAAQSAPTAPTGTVRFFDGATLLGTATLSGSTATLVTGGLAAGSRTIEARYDGDGSFLIGSRTAAHVVATTGGTPSIIVTSSRQPASTGQSVTFTASITVATTGTIQFYDGATLLGSASIASGLATFTTSSLAAGSHAVWARFTGTAGAPPAFSPVFVQAVNGSGWKDRTSTLALVSSANPSALGTTVTFTATASGSSGTPTGRILFLVDGFVVGDPTGVAMTNGQAAVSIATFGGGRHKVTATYLGNSNYRGSNGALTQTVN